MVAFSPSLGIAPSFAVPGRHCQDAQTSAADERWEPGAHGCQQHAPADGSVLRTPRVSSGFLGVGSLAGPSRDGRLQSGCVTGTS